MYKLVRMLYDSSIDSSTDRGAQAMITFTATVTDTNARRILNALRASSDTGAQALVAELKAHLKEQPVRCYHCAWTFIKEATYAVHLAAVHHYETNEEVEERGEKPEDTAETNAWTAFHNC